MTPTTFRERLADAEDGVDPEEFVAALQYVRETGRDRRR